MGHPETLLVTRTIASNPEWHFYLGNPREKITLAEMVRAASGREQIEETLQTGKGDAGLRRYEVRSWVGWHHHMTLSLLAQWFLVKEQRGAQKKDAGLTVSQLALVVAQLLRRKWPGPEARPIAHRVTYQLGRNEEARCHHYVARHHAFKTKEPKPAKNGSLGNRCRGP